MHSRMPSFPTTLHVSAHSPHLYAHTHIRSPVAEPPPGGKISARETGLSPLPPARTTFCECILLHCSMRCRLRLCHVDGCSGCRLYAVAPLCGWMHWPDGSTLCTLACGWAHMHAMGPSIYMRMCAYIDLCAMAVLVCKRTNVPPHRAYSPATTQRSANTRMAAKSPKPTRYDSTRSPRTPLYTTRARERTAIARRHATTQLAPRETRPVDQLTDTERMQCAHQYFLTGNLTEIAREMQIAYEDLLDMARSQWWTNEIRTLEREANAQLKVRLTKILGCTLDQLEDRLAHGDEKLDREGCIKRVAVSARDLSSIATAMFDKKREIEESANDFGTNEGRRLMALAEALRAKQIGPPPQIFDATPITESTPAVGVGPAAPAAPRANVGADASCPQRTEAGA
jgi:hypothetical protein